MKKTILINVYLFFVFLAMSCTKKSESNEYFENSTQLMTQLSLEMISSNSCNCVVNLNHNILDNILEERPRENVDRIKEKLSKELNFKSINLLEHSLELSKNFHLNEVKTKKGRIFARKEWDSLLIKSNKDYKIGLIENKYSIIDSLCNRKVFYITKPVFNKDYSIAAVYLDDMFGLPATWYSIYVKKDEEWILYLTE